LEEWIIGELFIGLDTSTGGLFTATFALATGLGCFFTICLCLVLTIGLTAGLDLTIGLTAGLTIGFGFGFGFDLTTGAGLDWLET